MHAETGSQTTTISINANKPGLKYNDFISKHSKELKRKATENKGEKNTSKLCLLEKKKTARKVFFLSFCKFCMTKKTNEWVNAEQGTVLGVRIKLTRFQVDFVTFFYHHHYYFVVIIRSNRKRQRLLRIFLLYFFFAYCVYLFQTVSADLFFVIRHLQICATFSRSSISIWINHDVIVCLLIYLFIRFFFFAQKGVSYLELLRI